MRDSLKLVARESPCPTAQERQRQPGAPLQLMKQGNIPCNHSIYSRCWQKGGGGGLEGRKSCKI